MTCPYNGLLNSLIIHQIKTKKISTLLLRLLLSFCSHLRQCFIGYPNTSNFTKNTPLHAVFSPLFSVFGYPDETLSLVFDILYENQKTTRKCSRCFRLLELYFDLIITNAIASKVISQTGWLPRLLENTAQEVFYLPFTYFSTATDIVPW